MCLIHIYINMSYDYVYICMRIYMNIYEIFMFMMFFRLDSAEYMKLAVC